MTKSYKNPENLELSILTRANKFLSSSESVPNVKKVCSSVSQHNS